MRSDYQEVFQNARLNECLPKLIVGIVLMAIGLLNFANMLVTKTMVRRKEFAVYQSLGMTSGQLRWLLLTEGLLHGVLLTVILLPVTFSVTCKTVFRFHPHLHISFKIQSCIFNQDS